MSKAFALLAVFFVKTQTVSNNFDYRILVINAGELSCEPGVAAELAPQLDPEPFLPFGQGSGRTRRDTLATFEA